KKERKPAARKNPPLNPFGSIDDDSDNDDDDSDNEGRGRKGKLSMGLGFTLTEDTPSPTAEKTDESSDRPKKRQKKGRWDAAPTTASKEEGKMKTDSTDKMEVEASDALDNFMDKLQSGELGNVTTQVSSGGTELLTIDVGGSMMRVPKLQKQAADPVAAVSGGVITSEQIEQLTGATATNSGPKLSKNKRANPDALYTQSDWESDTPSGTGGATSASEADTDDEEEEKARRAFIEALKSAPTLEDLQEDDTDAIKKPSLAAEVKTEKDRRERMLRSLEQQAEEARTLAEKSAAPDLGRLYNDAEGGIMEEAERNLDAAMAEPDALQVLAELNKKKELKSVDHSQIDYIPFKKNLYIVPRSLARLRNDEVVDLRAKLKVRVRGHGAPAPVSSFEQCGLSERILKVLEKQGITKPFPVQAQCIPCVMAGRDTIGIAKTGSGKTLAFLLPLLRHIMMQPPLGPNESGPIGMILAPARELAYQIHLVCKTFTKSLGLK
ncbi:MAG: hypothetical protein SGILL_001402, partial [Bacillariaceae sp.]